MNRRLHIIILALVVLFGATWLAKRMLLPMATDQEPATGIPLTPAQRIISRAPSITETLFAMDLGDRVIGVTPWCDYPPAASDIPRTGGLLDPNYERILSLKPDLVIMTTGMTSGQELEYLKKLGIRPLPLPQKTIADFMAGIEKIGHACGVEQRAQALQRELQDRIQAVRQRTRNRQAPRVLIVIGREYSQPRITAVHAAGNINNLFNDMLQLANGENAYRGTPQEYPELSAENIVKLNPDIIIEITGGAATDVDNLREHWHSLPPIKAVKNAEIHFLIDSAEGRPGPRFIETLETLATLLHPGAVAAGGSDD